MAGRASSYLVYYDSLSNKLIFERVSLESAKISSLHGILSAPNMEEARITSCYYEFG